jgi:hypothetical protein
MTLDDREIPGGIWRRVFSDSVQFLPISLRGADGGWDYAVFKFPFVPGFHLCLMEDDFDMPLDVQEIILSTHKTLHEAMGICRVLLANGGIHHD